MIHRYFISLLMETTEEMLQRREAELKAMQKYAREELKKVRLAREAMPTSGAPLERKPAEIKEGTIKDQVLTVLEEEFLGATTDEIITLVKEKFGRPIERTSMTPQLSRLKQDGKITQNDHGHWLIVDPRENVVKFLGGSEGN